MGTRVKTPKAILSYPHLDKPQAPQEDGGVPKYSGAFIFTPETLKDPAEKALYVAMQNAVVEAAVAKFGEQKGKEMLAKKQLKTPFRTDWESKDYPEGSIFINARSNNQPQAVYSYADPSDPKKPARIPAEKLKEELYAGALVRASVSAFYYDKKGNKGIGFGLNNIQKLGEGERIDGRAKAEDEFDVDMSSAPADLDALVS